MAFRYLRQKVPEFDDFLGRATSGNSDVSKELLGARMVGRWKSGKFLRLRSTPGLPSHRPFRSPTAASHANRYPGAPLDLAPKADDKDLAKNKDKNNDFQFKEDDDDAANPHSRCPFAAHIRKTHPRKDLDLDTMSEERVLRRGIPYGPEVGTDETESRVSKKDRGLLFVSYQSHLSRGFVLMQKCELISFQSLTLASVPFWRVDHRRGTHSPRDFPSPLHYFSHCFQFTAVRCTTLILTLLPQRSLGEQSKVHRQQGPQPRP
jgi:deferrochelatase/peroxidase EfeB